MIRKILVLYKTQRLSTTEFCKKLSRIMQNPSKQTKLKSVDDTPSDIRVVMEFIAQAKLVEFRIGNHIRVPAESGVYLFSDFTGPLYAGKTNNLYNRFSEHRDRSHNLDLSKRFDNPFGKIKFHFLPTATQIDVFERALIRTLNPLYNKIKYSGR